jgi:Fe-S-cluster containining protein
MSAEHLPLESRLCTSCGMCCDGTMFTSAKASADEMDFVRSLGLEPRSAAHASPGFNLPCHFLSGTVCTIYDRRRPSVCSSFACKMLNLVRNGDMPGDEGFRLIAKAREAADALISSAKEQDIGKARQLASEIALRGAEGRQELEIVLHFAMLERFLDKHFRKERPAPKADGATGEPEMPLNPPSGSGPPAP